MKIIKMIAVLGAFILATTVWSGVWAENVIDPDDPDEMLEAEEWDKEVYENEEEAEEPVNPAEEIALIAKDLTLNQEMMVQIAEEETVFLRFVPKETDGYRLISLSTDQETDPAVYLYDEHMNLVKTDDDDGEGVNFRINAILEKGKTYYYGCDVSSENGGSYPVRLEKVSGLIGAEAADLPEGIQKNMMLDVRAIATKGTNVTYQWYEGKGEAGDAESVDDLIFVALEGENRSKLIVANPEMNTGYCCTVSEGEVNQQAVYFFFTEDEIQVYNNASFDQLSDETVEGSEETDHPSEEDGEDTEEDEEEV